MLVGPILLLIIVPAVMSMILDWRREPRPLVSESGQDLAST
jgi:hypothetical protein